MKQAEPTAKTESTKTEGGIKHRVDRAYQAGSSSELAEVYNDWAEKYEADLVHELGWDGPQQTVRFLVKYAKPQNRILDIGAGTGLVGHYLTEKGYEDVSALDMSEKMLSEARKKDVYKRFYFATLGQKLEIADKEFDSVIASGVFTEGHAGPEAFDELIRITKPGGYIVFSLRPEVREKLGFKEVIEEYQKNGRWKLVEESDFLQGFTDHQTEPYKIWVYQVS